MTAKINFSGGGVSASNTFGFWTNLLSAADAATVDILDFATGADTGWNITVVGSGINTSNGGVNTVGSGDAAFVDEAKCSYNLHNLSGAAEGQYKIDGLNNSNTYTLRHFPSRDSSSSTRIGEYSANGFSSVQELDASLNSTGVVIFSNISPVAGEIFFNWRVKDDTGYAYSNAMEITENAAAGATIDDFNTDEIILDAETGNTATVSDFGSDITSIKLVSGTAETTMLNLAGTGNSYTFDAPDVATYVSDTAGCPFTTASHAVSCEVTDGTDTDSLVGTYSPKAGWAVTEVNSAVKTAGSVFEDFTGTIVDSSQVLLPDDVFISSIGILTTNRTTDADGQFWDASDDTWKQFSIIIGESDTTSPIVTNPTASSITLSGCTPQVTTDEGNGAAYMVVVPDGDIPSVAQIKLGQQSSGAAAIDSENVVVSSVGVVSFSATANGSNSTDYEVYFVHTDAASNDSLASTSGFTTSAVDTTKPVITLLGSPVVNVAVDTSYTDAGAAAEDDVDGVITGNIATVNPVNIAIIAQYTVTYNVSDAAANAADEVTRTVNVIAASTNDEACEKLALSLGLSL